MDFVTDFPLVVIPSIRQEINAVLVIVDRLSKIIYFIPLKFGDNEASSEIITKLLFDHVFRLYGFPKEIISDRDARFIFGIICWLY